MKMTKVSRTMKKLHEITCEIMEYNIINEEAEEVEETDGINTAIIKNQFLR